MALELGIKLTANTFGFTGAINSASKALSDTLAKSLSQAKVSLDQLDPAIQQAVQGIDLMNFDQVSAAMQQFTQDGQLMASFVEQLKADLGSVDDQEAFTELSTVIAQAEAQLKTLSATENQNTTSAKSLKAQLREMTAELARMEVAGLRGTDAYNQLSAEAGRVKDAINDASDSIKTLASDTRTLDAGVDIANGLVGAFQAYQGALALTGQNNDEAAKSLQKLMAIMTVAQGIQQVGTFLTGQSAGAKVLDTTITYAQSVAYRVLGTSIGTASVATRGFATALAATGIGAIAIAIGVAVSALIDFVDTTEEAEAASKKLNDELERQSQILDLDLASLDRFNRKRIAELKATGATEEQIFAAENQARQDDLARLKQALTAKNKAYNDQLANRYADAKETQKIFEEKTKLEEQIANKETQIIEAGYEYIKKTEDKRKEQETKHNEEIKKSYEDRVKIVQQNEQKLRAEYEKLSAENLDINTDFIQKELDDRRAAASVFGSEESASYKVLQQALFNLKKQRIDNEYKTERDSLIKLGALTSETGKKALAELEANYSSKILKLQVEVAPLTSFNSADLQKGVTDIFGKTSITPNIGFQQTIAEVLGAQGPKDEEAIGIYNESITNQLEQSRATIESGLEDSITGAADAIGNILANGGGIGNALAAAGQVILKTIGGVFQALGKQLIAAAITVKALKESLKTLFANPIGALVVGVGLVALGGILKNIKLLQATPFAEGGIVTGPTMGLVGEAGKEAIIPLDRIGEVLGSIGGSQNVFVTGQLSGETIYLQQQRVSQRRGRFV